MPGTLLIGNPGSSWREWLKAHRGGRDLLCLDPADAIQGVPGRICLFRDSRPLFERFYGSLDPQRYPHVILAALAEGLRLMEGEGLVQSFAYRPTPVLRHLLVIAAQLMQPEAILVASGTSLDLNGFPVGPATIELDAAFPKVVHDAQRKAQWIRLLEHCTPHTFPLKSVAFEGSRLGSGLALDAKSLEKFGLHDALFVVIDRELEDHRFARALDLTHTTRLHLANPRVYENLFCSFARQSGEDFGVGFVSRIDWESGQITVLNDAVPPAPVRILRLGAIRVDPKGRELDEVSPWQV